MSSLVQHAKRELRSAGLFDADADYNGEIAVQVTSLMEVFAAYSHSGGSSEQTLSVFDKLARGMPLTALTGDDDEWQVPKGKGGQIAQNMRCPFVFKDDEMAWDVRRGRVAISFPYQPD